ncbi:putative replication factor A 1, rfa1, partial [Gregarina niphandrodes]
AYLKISDLTAYAEKWRILARVTNKSPIREYTNARGQGKLFNVDLIDADGVEIRASFFQDAVDKFYYQLEVNKAFLFSNGSIKPANPRFKRFDHPCELTFGSDAEIVPAPQEEVATIPKTTLAPKELKAILSMNVNDTLDVIGVCNRIYQTSIITVRSTGAQKEKRSISIVDSSGYVCDVTLWGNDCHLIPENIDDGSMEYYVAIKRARVEEFNGRRLSSNTGNIQVFAYNLTKNTWDTDELLLLEAIMELQKWYSENNARQFTKVSNNSSTGSGQNVFGGGMQTISELHQQCQNSTELQNNGLYFNVVASIVETNVTTHKKFYWTSCPSCNKKVTSLSDGALGGGLDDDSYHCDNCNMEVKDPERKYIFQLTIQDATDTLRLSVLGESGTELIGMSANDVEMLKYRPGIEGQEFLDVFNDLRRSEYIFRIQAKNETWQDETRLKYRLMSSEKIQGDTLTTLCKKQAAMIDELLR